MTDYESPFIGLTQEILGTIIARGTLVSETEDD